VADALQADLEAVSKPGTVRFTRRKEQRTFFGLRHLFAELRSQAADGIDAVAVVRALSPHGAAIGYPRRDASAVIGELEPVPRGPRQATPG
jgi:anthranilate/para-aminobenzoate synthase component I